MRRLTTPAFADHFSAHAAVYATYRPRYPVALFHWLAVVSRSTELAWDAGTGNGQVALGLTTRFARVIATDASAEQIAQARPHPRVRFEVGTTIPDVADGSVDLITVGQALHWFDLPPFLAEAKRVIRPQGVFAAFCYGLTRVSPAVDELVQHHYSVTLGPHWPAERRHIEDGYRSLALPLDEMVPPPLEMTEDWGVENFIGYLRSWSATQRFIAARGEGAVLEFEAALRQRWGALGIRRRVSWPLTLRVGHLR